MSAINDYFEQAQLSLAAYAEDLGKGWVGGGTEEKLTQYGIILTVIGMGSDQAN